MEPETSKRKPEPRSLSLETPAKRVETQRANGAMATDSTSAKAVDAAAQTMPAQASSPEHAEDLRLALEEPEKLEAKLKMQVANTIGQVVQDSG